LKFEIENEKLVVFCLETGKYIFKELCRNLKTNRTKTHKKHFHKKCNKKLQEKYFFFCAKPPFDDNLCGI
jgi:hypothetical protein